MPELLLLPLYFYRIVYSTYSAEIHLIVSNTFQNNFFTFGNFSWINTLDISMFVLSLSVKKQKTTVTSIPKNQRQRHTPLSRHSKSRKAKRYHINIDVLLSAILNQVSRKWRQIRVRICDDIHIYIYIYIYMCVCVLAKVTVRFFESHSRLTGVTTAERRRYLSNINVIFNR